MCGVAEVAIVVARGGGGAGAAEELDAPVLTDFGFAAEEDDADLTGGGDVGAAAGLKIRASDFDYAEHTLARNLLADSHGGELFGSGVADEDRTVFKDDVVGGAFGAFEDGVAGFGALQIDGAEGFAEVEGDGGEAEALLEHGGEEMLAGVLLHVVEAAGPVHAAGDFAAGEFAVDDVEDFARWLVVADIENVGFV